MNHQSLPDDRDELIQRYLDGDLNTAEKIGAERLIAGDEKLRKALADYERIGRMLREAYAAQEAQEILDGRLETIRRRSAEPARGEGWERLRIAIEELLGYRKRVWIPAMATLVAAVSAVSLALLLSGKMFPTGSVNGGEETWSRVTSVSLGTGVGSMILEIEDNTGTKAAILWVLSESEPAPFSARPLPSTSHLPPEEAEIEE